MKGFNFYFSWWNFAGAYQNGFDEVCGMCSSKNIAQVLTQSESLNVTHSFPMHSFLTP